MKGTRPISCALVLILATATQLSLDPLLGGGVDAVDVSLLLLLWFALVDRTGRVLILTAVVGSSRLIGGASSAIEVFLPLLAAIAWTRFARGGIDPRDNVRRIAIVAGALAFANWTHRAIWEVPLTGSVGPAATGLLMGTFCAIVLFPILDRLVPLLRSATHPM